MGCTHSKAGKDREHRRKIKIKEVLESSTQDPNNVLKMHEPQPKPAPIVDASGDEDGPDGAIRLTEPSMKPRRHPAKAHTSVTRNTASSSGSTEEIWAKLHLPQAPQSTLSTSPHQGSLQNDVGPARSVDVPHGVQPTQTEARLPEIINSPHKGRVGQDAMPSQWKTPEMSSDLKTDFKHISNKQAHEAASPSRLSQVQARTSKVDLMFGPPEISFRKASSQHIPPQPMGTEQAFGIKNSDSSRKKGSKRVHKAASHVNDNSKAWDKQAVMHGSSNSEPAPVIPNAGDERVHGGRWHRKSKPDSPIHDSISNQQMGRQSIGSGPSTSDGLSVILDTQYMGSTADSTPRLMMDSPRLPAPRGVTVLGSPVKQPDVPDECARDTGPSNTFRVS